VLSFHGHLSALWKCRIWFVFTVVIIAIRNGVEYLVENYWPFRTKIYDLKPRSTIEGFIAGVIATLVFYITVGQAIVQSEWARAQPIAFSFVPFDKTSYKLAEGGLFEKHNVDLSLGNFGTLNISYSQVQIYLFVLTLFVAFISPFGGFAVAGLKRAMRSSHKHVKHGLVVDRLECLIVVGFFMMIFIARIVYQEKDISQVASMIQAMTPEAKALLLQKLRNPNQSALI